MKRATTVKIGDTIKINDFNPRPREEGDQVSQAIKVFGKYFNPRPREEGDGYDEYNTCGNFVFQSTPS